MSFKKIHKNGFKVFKAFHRIDACLQSFQSKIAMKRDILRLNISQQLLHQLTKR